MATMKRTEVMVVTRDEVLDALRSYGWPIGYSELLLRPEINSSGELLELRFVRETEEAVYPVRLHELTAAPATPPELEQLPDQVPPPAPPPVSPPTYALPVLPDDIPF